MARDRKSAAADAHLAGTGVADTDAGASAFISYSRGSDDQKLQFEFALLLAARLKQLGFDPFIDQEGISAGENWKKQVREAIFQPRRFTLLLLSPEFVLSYHCREEHAWAGQHAHATGKRVIPLMLEVSRSVQAYVAENGIEHESWISLEQLYAAFLAARGEPQTQEWQAGFSSACGEIAAALRDAYQDYATRLHAYLVTDYRDPFFEESRDVFDYYPKNYRDPFYRVVGWVSEGFAAWQSDSKAEFAPNFPRELFIIASQLAQPVGVLYATLYPGRDDRTPICLVQVLSLARDPLLAELERKGLTRNGSVADRLLAQLRREIRKLSPRCELVFAVLPKLEAGAGRPVLGCWRAWRHVRADAAYALCECPSFRFIQPDMDYEGEEDFEFDPKAAALIFLGEQDQLSWLSRLRLEKVLRLLYWVVYAETYYNPYCIHEWWQHIDSLYRQAASALRRRKLADERLPLKPLRIGKG